MKPLIIILLIVFLSGCKTYKINASKAHLFDVKKCSDSSEFKKQCLQQRGVYKNEQFHVFGSNPVFIAKDSKFSVEINAIKPPSLYYDSLSENVPFSSVGNGKKYGPLSGQNIEKNIRDRQLWLLTTVRSQNISDPLEANSKVYIKSTQVKWDSGSHLLIPLDKDEKAIFTHESDLSYKVSFQLLEVNALSVKKQLAILRNQSGIANLLQTGLNTLADLVHVSIGKDILKEKVNPILQNDTAFQRLLLSIGASVEFFGDILILRDDLDFIDKYPNELAIDSQFYLMDGYRLPNKKTDQGEGVNRVHWKLKPENSKSNHIDSELNNGGIFSENQEQAIFLSDVKNSGDAPGFISLTVSQIPISANDINNNDSNHLNSYYDYSRLYKFLNQENKKLFNDVIECYSKSGRNKVSECKKLHQISGLKIDELTEKESVLTNRMFKSEVEDYINVDQKYKSVDDLLTCYEIYRSLNRNNQLSLIDELNLTCVNKSDVFVDDYLNEIILGINSEKESLGLKRDKLRDFLTQKMFENVNENCIKDKNRSLNISINTYYYDCSLFEAISQKQNKFNRLVELINRRND